MRVAVIGLGYVGLVTAGGLTEWGHEVIGVDTDADRVAKLQSGHLPLHEPDLATIVAAALANGRLRITDRLEDAILSAHLVLIAVSTTDEQGSWQTRTLLRCLADVVPAVPDDTPVVVRSTIPPLFVKQMTSVVEELRSEAGRQPIPLLINPEFTREGTAVRDFLAPDRVVIGVAADPHGRGAYRLRQLYRRAEAPILVQRAIDACVAKLGSNLFLATKISFANELAALCDLFDASVEEVVGAMAHDRRIGGSFLRAGVGFGGSCLPHQVTDTVRIAQAAGLHAPLLDAVDTVNLRQRGLFVERLAGLLGGELSGRRIALLGLTFKPDTDDLRGAPALAIARALLSEGAVVIAYDPLETAARRAAELVPGMAIASSAFEALDRADAAGLLTEWEEFQALDWTAAARVMRQPILVDGRNALPVARMLAAGFIYSSFGRGTHRPEALDLVASPVGREAALADLGQLGRGIIGATIGEEG